jgi:hypothetical protein
MRMGRSLSWLGLLGLWALSAAAAENPETADLRLRLPAGETLRYAWTLDAVSNSKGQEFNKPLDLHLDKSIRMTAVVLGEAPPRGEKGLAAVLRFEDVGIQENRRIGDASRSSLQLDKQSIVFKDNDRVVIDSRNDVGLDKLTEYQRSLRALQRSAVRLFFDSAGRQTRVEGDRLLLSTVHGGHSQGLFPTLSGESSKLGASWDGRFELPALAELKLTTPASVRTRATFAKWEQYEGRRVALLDVLAAWDSHDLEGTDEGGLSVAITRLEAQGAGVYFFDPQQGRFMKGTMTFQMKYHLQGKRENDMTELDVTGRARVNFSLLPPDPKAEAAADARP